jgi:hypothetical protein
MNADFTADELHKRLEALDRNLEAAANRIMTGGASTAAQQRQIEVLRLKSSTLRQRLVEAKNGDWDSIKASLQTDWDGLSESLERWMKELDKNYQDGSLRDSLR